ncbi:unannotated protein [freshwater metagenome]|uniref:Unannotated protein n=1 Tax=freshwater metagenome TaxID=449393 RepID=A0A6J6AWV1_9ZZZZ
MGRGGHAELEGCLQIRLLKDGEHATAVWHLELGVNINLAVNRVNESVQAFAGVHEVSISIDYEGVFGCKVWQLDSNAIRNLRYIKLLAIQIHRANRRGDCVNESGCTGRGSKLHRGF